MNSNVSLSCLVTVIAIFVTVTAVSGGTHILSPPAKIAGHNEKSLIIHKEVFGAGSKITDEVAINNTPPNTTPDDDSYKKIKCCDPNGIDDQLNLCTMCNRMCHVGGMDARHEGHLLRTQCVCHAVPPCTHISYVIKKAEYVGANEVRNNNGDQDDVQVAYGMFTMSAKYQLTYLILSIVSLIFIIITSIVYFFLQRREHSRYTKNLTMSIASSTYISLIAETIRKPSTEDFQSTGIYKLLFIINTHGWQLATIFELANILKLIGNVSKFNRNISKRTTFHKFGWFFQLVNISITFYYIDIFHQVDESIISLFQNHEILGVEIPFKLSIWTGLVPGLVNIIVYVYLFKYNEIQISSVHPDLSIFYEKRISTRNQMFKISLLLFTVDILYILDITMEWDFTGTHILHLLKPAQGILVSYVLLFRPLTLVLYNKLLKCLRRRKRRANEVTANPIYTITTV